MPEPIVNETIVYAMFGERLPTMSEWEMSLIGEAVRRAGSKAEAAKLIGIGKTTLYRKLRSA